MELHGTIISNLEAAIASARRLQGHPVYKDTLTYWGELLQEARRAQQAPAGGASKALDDAVVRLEIQLAERRK